MEKLDNYVEEFYSMDDLEKNLTSALNKAYNSSGSMVQVIKAQTAAGKTTAYLNLMESNPSKRFLIAASSNILKNQIYADANKRLIAVRKTPSLEEIKGEIPKRTWSRISYLYETGKYRSVHPYIEETLKRRDIPRLREYLKRREQLRYYTGSLITTHRYLLNMDEKRLSEFDAIIVDEDIILKSVVPNNGEITLSDCKKLLESANDSRLVSKIEQLIKLAETKSEAESSIELDSFDLEAGDDDDEDSIDDGESDGISMAFDIPSFSMAKHFFFVRASLKNNLKDDTFIFMKPVTFKGCKYIIVSATADEKIYRYYFGWENVSFHECKQVKYKGTLNQYYDKSYSRSCIDEDPGIIDHLMKRFDIARVITHKKYDIGPLHFGNTEGSNQYEGRDILVIGTPYHAGFLYKLFALTMGLDFDENSIMKSRLVTHNGYWFTFTTFDDEVLRDIHFWMIESELEQAVGRARLLRHDCTVHLFSNFPLRQANLMKFKYCNDKTIELFETKSA